MMNSGNVVNNYLSTSTADYITADARRRQSAGGITGGRPVTALSVAEFGKSF
jgi:hypothetical protein